MMLLICVSFITVHTVKSTPRASTGPPNPAVEGKARQRKQQQNFLSGCFALSYWEAAAALGKPFFLRSWRTKKKINRKIRTKQFPWV